MSTLGLLLHDTNAESEFELSVNKGDIVEVVDEVPLNPECNVASLSIHVRIN